MSTITPNGYQLEQYLIAHYRVIGRIHTLQDSIEKAKTRLQDIELTVRLTPDYAREAHGNNVSDPVATAYTHAIADKERLNANISLYYEQISHLEDDITDMQACLQSLGLVDQVIVRTRYTINDHTGKPTPCWKIGIMLGEELGPEEARDERTVRRHLCELIFPEIIDYLVMYCPTVLRRICDRKPPEKRVINTRYKSAFFEEIAV